MSQENKEQSQLAEIELQNMTFANNPELYQEIWGDGPEEIDESEIQWTVPTNEFEVADALNDLKDLGLLP